MVPCTGVGMSVGGMHVAGLFTSSNGDVFDWRLLINTYRRACKRVQGEASELQERCVAEVDEESISRRNLFNCIESC